MMNRHNTPSKSLGYLLHSRRGLNICGGFAKAHPSYRPTGDATASQCVFAKQHCSMDLDHGILSRSGASSTLPSPGGVRIRQH